MQQTQPEDEPTMIQRQADDVMRTVLDKMEQRSRLTALLDPRLVPSTNTGDFDEHLPDPRNWQQFINPNAEHRWQIGLHKLGADIVPLGLIINQDVLLGRGGPTQQPSSIDLSEYAAQEHGVSRIHAMLRPTRNKLFIIDMQSTNGTQVNAHPIGPSTARALETDDIISLGDLTFILKVYDRP